MERVIVATLEEKLPDATQWSTWSNLARIRDQAAPHRDLQALHRSAVRGEGPRRVGLYLNPPERALVLCADAKSQVLDRSQPIFPLMPGVPERRTHDYRRHGTTSLFAAMDIATGRVIGQLHRRHRAIEFRKFLERIDAEVAAELDVHLILDSYALHADQLLFERVARYVR